MSSPKQEPRTFQHIFLGMYNNTRRVFNNRRKVNKGLNTYFHTGFAFKKLPNDATFVLENCDNNHDLFSYYYDKLLESGELKTYVQELTTFFEPKGKPKPGCLIHDSRKEVNANSGKSDSVYEESDENITSRKTVVVPQTNGSCVLAKQPFKEGEIVMKEIPLVLCRSPCCKCSGNYYFECNHCSKVIDRYHCCPDCNLAIYCSNKCKTEAYSQYHMIECKAFRIHFFGKSDIAWVAFRMLLMGINFKFSARYTLKHMDTLGLLRKTMLMLSYLVMYTDFFEMAHEQACFPAYMSTYEMHIMVGGLLITNIKQACVSTFYFPDEKYSLHTYTNGNRFETPGFCKKLISYAHCCKPNATVIFDNNAYYIKALCNISANMEITINYVHLDEEFYGSSYKYKCRCSLCAVPQKYTGKLYKCFKCIYPKGQKMEHYPPMWKCSDCSTFETNPEMDAKLERLDQMLLEITCMDSTDYKAVLSMLLLYLDMYDTVYTKIYPEHLYIYQKLVINAIENSDLDTIEKYTMSLVEVLGSILHKHSFQRLEILVSIVCAIEMKLLMQEIKGIQKLILIRQVLMPCIKSLCEFYMLMPQYQDFVSLVNQIEG